MTQPIALVATFALFLCAVQHAGSQETGSQNEQQAEGSKMQEVNAVPAGEIDWGWSTPPTFPNEAYGPRTDVNPDLIGDNHLFDVWAPDGDGPYPVMIYAHGGGFQSGDKMKAIGSMPRLAEDNIVFISIDYTLGQGGEVGVKDGINAIKYIKANHEQYRIDPEKIFLSGNSAGGIMMNYITYDLKMPGILGIWHGAYHKSQFADLSIDNLRKVGIPIAISMGKLYPADPGHSPLAAVTLLEKNVAAGNPGMWIGSTDSTVEQVWLNGKWTLDLKEGIDTGESYPTTAEWINSTAYSSSDAHTTSDVDDDRLQIDNAKGRPNILWIIAEDMSCHFGYQGQPLVHTPHVDRLAREGVAFTNAYVSSPVCSPSRSALITGMYQTSIGVEHHYTGRGTIKHHLPAHVRTIPELFKEAGYYTCNANPSFKAFGKTDYDFEYDMKALYDAPNWSGRKQGQPFFAQIQLTGGKLRNIPKAYEQAKPKIDNLITADQVTLPPYYPDDPVFRQDWAEYLNSVQYTDRDVGLILQRLKKESLLDNTVIFFITDHGISQARGKQFLYDEGTNIPFVVWAPGRVESGTDREEPISHIDMAATSLYFAGIDIPEYMQARPLFGPQARAREYVICARDRCDETVDRIRSVRKGDYKYIRNYYPKRPYLQPCIYKDRKPFMKSLRELHAAGKLDEVQSRLLAGTRPEEELYDLSKDRWEIHNLAEQPEHQDKLREMRAILEDWIIESDDQGRFPESEAAYDSAMKKYLDGMKKRGDTERAQELQDNINLMKQWKAEGK